MNTSPSMAHTRPAEMTADLLSILAIGDSHITGYEARTYTLDVVGSDRKLEARIQPVYVGGSQLAFESIVTFADGDMTLNPLLEAALVGRWPGLNVKAQPIDPNVRVIQHLVLSLGTALSGSDPAMDTKRADRLSFRHDMDFVLPAQPALPVDPACTLLPVNLIRDMFAATFTSLQTALGFLENMHPRRTWLVGSPPPSEDNAVKDRFLASRARAHGTPSVLLPPATVALKLWLLVNEIVQALCKECGVRFIDCSPVACNERGFLKPEYEHDGVHGNTRYNELMAQYIVSIIGTTEAAMTPYAAPT